MKILFVVPYVPTSIHVRTYSLIRYLSGRGHEITLFTLWSRNRERDDIDGIRQYCHQVKDYYLPPWRSALNSLQSLPSTLPVMAAANWHPEMHNAVKSMADSSKGTAQVDLVHVVHMRGARYGIFHSYERGDMVPLVWDSIDSLSLLYQQIAATTKDPIRKRWTAFELNRIALYEGWLVNRFDRVLVTSEADRSSLLAQQVPGSPQATITVLPNGVDLDYFDRPEKIRREPETVIFSGNMSQQTNIMMAMFLALEIMPLVWAQQPEVKLAIVGKDPVREVRGLATHPNITVTGTVSDIRPFLQKATVAVVPMNYGMGIQNKVLEAMASGTPVVATSEAISALDVRDGQGVIITQEPGDMVEAILALLCDPMRQEQVAKAGRAYVEQHHSWDDVVVKLEKIYLESIEAKIGANRQKK